MRTMRLKAPQPAERSPLEAADLLMPEPGRGEVRIKIAACGVCHTDLHTVEGDIHPPQMPVTPGHQVVGIIDEVGPGADGVLAGDRVGMPWLYQACGVCEFCARGDENLCPDIRFTGFHVDGGYAEYMLAPAHYTLPIPAAIPDLEAAPLLCAGIIGYRALHKADLQPGERLGLVGFGASAHLAIQVAHHWGCETSIFTRSEGHRRHAAELGAGWVGGVEDKIDAPLDRAVIFAPAGNLVPVILEKIRPGGTLAINAIHMSPIPEMPYRLLYGERTLRSVANATYQDGIDFLSLAAEIPVRVTVNPYPLDQANRALVDLKHSHFNGEAVLVIR